MQRGVKRGREQQYRPNHAQQRSPQVRRRMSQPQQSNEYAREKQVKRRLPGYLPVLIAAIIGTVYLIYAISYFSDSASSAASDAEAIGAGIATLLVMPHLICTGLAVVFNWLGHFLKKSTGFVLTAGILYSVAMVLFVGYFFFVVVEAVLCYVGYAKRKNALRRVRSRY